MAPMEKPYKYVACMEDAAESTSEWDRETWFSREMCAWLTSDADYIMPEKK